MTKKRKLQVSVHKQPKRKKEKTTTTMMMKVLLYAAP
jgi:hypothetical protein